MVSNLPGESKVTSCIIQIYDFAFDGSIEREFVAYNFQTAVKRYFIGLNNGNLINGSYPVELKVREPDYYGNVTFNLTYPLVIISERGFKAVQCPSIAGEWVWHRPTNIGFSHHWQSSRGIQSVHDILDFFGPHFSNFIAYWCRFWLICFYPWLIHHFVWAFSLISLFPFFFSLFFLMKKKEKNGAP